MKQSTYLSERKYNSTKAVPNFRKEEYWKNILGKEIYEKINESENGILRKVLSEDEFEEILDVENNVIWKLYVEKKYNKSDLVLDVETQKNAYPFSQFLAPFVRVAEDLLVDASKNNDFFCRNKKLILSEFENNLFTKLLDCSVRTLIFEMNLCREYNELEGSNPEEEYSFYTEVCLNNERYIIEIFENYPALVRSILDITEDILEFYQEVTNRYENDLDDLKREFGVDLELMNISVGGSDSHNHGKSVVLFEFENNKKILYKPHSIASEKMYYFFLRWIGQCIEVDMKSYIVIDRKDYGWEECVIPLACDDEIQLSNYYRRMGVILCVNYILNAYDIHNENIIASGGYPIIIDTETILKNFEEYDVSRINSYTLNKIRESVIGQGLLPIHMRKGKSTPSIDLSGMAHEGGEEYPVKIPVIINENRSDPRYEYRYIKSTSQNNLPIFKGKGVLPGKYLDDIVCGFERAYVYVINNKEKVIDNIRGFKMLKLRHLRRDTQTYAMVLETSYHPDFMIDSAYREIFLMTLAKNKKIDSQKEYFSVKDEVLQLVHNDIPFYYYNADSRDLYSAYGLHICDYFERTAYDLVLEKVENMNMHDLKQQRLYIVLSILSLEDISSIGYNISRKRIDYLQPNSLNSNESFEKVIMHATSLILKRLYQDAILTPDRKKANWIGVSLGGIEDVKWNVMPLSYNLYDGIGGIAIFCHTYNELYKNDMSRELCQAVDETLNEHLEDIIMVYDKMGTDQSSGGFVGEGSLMYVYTVLFDITGRTDYIKNAEKLYSVVKTQVQIDKDNDITSGNAGIIITLLKMYHITGNKKYLDLAILAGDVLLKNGNKDNSETGWTYPGQPYSVSGLSHGYSGIALALFKLGQVTGNEKYTKIAKKAIIEENSMYSEAFGNWADRRLFKGRTGEERGNNPVTWCHGAAGILLARLKIYPYVDSEFKEIITADISKAANTLIRLGGLKNQCLCHGQVGNLEILFEYTKFLNDKDLKDMEHNTLIECLKRNKEYWNCGLVDGYEHYGFMLGISGIGYSLLRRVKKELPCILNLE